MPYEYDVHIGKVRLWRKNLPEGMKKPGEELTGLVRNRVASVYEERYAKSLDKNKKIDSWKFEVLVYTEYQIPGQLNQVDFFVWVGGILYPTEVDGDWVHKSAEAHANDEERDAILNEVLQQRYPGSYPIIRIPGYMLETQEMSDAVARELY